MPDTGDSVAVREVMAHNGQKPTDEWTIRVPRPINWTELEWMRFGSDLYAAVTKTMDKHGVKT